MKFPPENELDVSVGVVPPDQTFREIVNLPCVVDPVKVEFPWSTNWYIPSVQIDVASYASVLDSDQFGYVVNMVHNIFDRGGASSPDKGADHSDTDNATLCRHSLERFIRLATGAVRNQRPAVGMSNEDRPSGGLDSVQGSPVAAMRDVHGHANLVHAPNDRHAVFAQATIFWPRRSTADPVAAIRQLRDPLAQTVEAIHILDRSKVFGILLADQDADPAERLGPFEIGGALHTQELVLMRGDKRVPPVNVPQ